MIAGMAASTRVRSDFAKARKSMPSTRSSLKARINNRLVLHLRAVPFRLRNERPMVSFTFDDAPVSAATTGAAMLEEFDARGTFYVAGSLAGTRSDKWTTAGADHIVDLHRRGHEIACHTFSHKRATELNAATMAAEIAKNRRYLLALDASIRIENFAYPYGAGSVLRKGQLGKAFRSSRGILPGINRGTVDLQYLRAMPLIDELIDHDGIDRALDEAIDSNGWLIFYSHDVEPEPSPFGCSPSLLRYALEAASRRQIPKLSVADALRLAGA
jgi:peptidoglycan/xylan/chitin deacetylase (PgdA/CDA1 family)